MKKPATFQRSLPERDATAERVFTTRRTLLAAPAALLAGCEQESEIHVGPPYPATRNYALSVSLPATPRETAETYNNYIEFAAQSKELPAKRAARLPQRPWILEVTGLVQKPRVFDIEWLLKRMPFEERVYRFRCVEAWAMVVPWTGFPLAALLQIVDPLANAQFVRFVSASLPEVMPGMTVSDSFPWPYSEALRIDEAMHPLTMLVTGAYGRPMAPQNGAPIRLIVPWKYGFKSAKSVVRIELLPERPETFWNALQPMEYGFFANVNPLVSHPRWPQNTERLLPEFRKRPTLPFNGYAADVAGLYTGNEH